MRHHTLIKLVSLTFATLLSIVLAESAASAAFGDCVSWIWGGKNQETSYSTAASYSSAMQNKDQESGPLGELSPAPYGHAPTVTDPVICYPQQPVYCPPIQQVSTSKVDSSPYQPPSTTTVMKPVVTKEWSYSRIKTVDYKPVQTFDPKTGVASAEYRREESKSLLPWLHRKETVRYEPQTIPTPTPSTSVVKANYAPDQQSYPASYLCVDAYGNVLSQNGIPSEIAGYSGSYPSSAAMSSSVYVSQNVGGSQPVGPIPTYGTPDLLLGAGSRETRLPISVPQSDMRSEADLVPVLPPQSSNETYKKMYDRDPTIQLAGANRPIVNNSRPIASIATTDIHPIKPISEDALETASRERAAKSEHKPETPLKTVAPKSGELVHTPTPVFDSEPLNLVRGENTKQFEPRNSASPTRTKLQYKPAGMP